MGWLSPRGAGGRDWLGSSGHSGGSGGAGAVPGCPLPRSLFMQSLRAQERAQVKVKAKAGGGGLGGGGGQSGWGARREARAATGSGGRDLSPERGTFKGTFPCSQECVGGGGGAGALQGKEDAYHQPCGP